MNKNTVNSVGSHCNGNNSETIQNPIRKTGRSVYRSGKHEVNLRKRGFLRFQIGLIVAMAMVYFALEASFETFKSGVPEQLEPVTELVEYHADAFNFTVEAPHKERPEKIQKKSEFFKIEDDDLLVKADTEFIQKPQALTNSEDVGAIDYEEVAPVIDDIPIVRVQEAPIFPGCEKVAKTKRLACFNKKIKKHIQRNFRYPSVEQKMNVEGLVHTMFKIDRNGNITDIQLRGPSIGLENEALRIIDKLPQMTPGNHNGKAVRVTFSIPINFQIQ